MYLEVREDDLGFNSLSLVPSLPEQELNSLPVPTEEAPTFEEVLLSGSGAGVEAEVVVSAASRAEPPVHSTCIPDNVSAVYISQHTDQPSKPRKPAKSQSKPVSQPKPKPKRASLTEPQVTIINCPTCGIEIYEKDLQKHSDSIHGSTKPQNPHPQLPAANGFGGGKPESSSQPATRADTEAARGGDTPLKSTPGHGSTKIPTLINCPTCGIALFENQLQIHSDRTHGYTEPPTELNRIVICPTCWLELYQKDLQAHLDSKHAPKKPPKKPRNRRHPESKKRKADQISTDSSA
ncbi:hypothetical protein LTR97_006999 [Elasticomyces elasticus]|uniref:Uncharacterized protein n=1 Tax=Elasticomyces elasticus TaxID=574655 RepID=A0AAN8A0E2_9PEZI|nr:hypothetical protein LTR97_006999 [Elasticomyces elasticus]